MGVPGTCASCGGGGAYSGGSHQVVGVGGTGTGAARMAGGLKETGGGLRSALGGPLPPNRTHTSARAMGAAAGGGGLEAGPRMRGSLSRRRPGALVRLRTQIRSGGRSAAGRHGGRPGRASAERRGPAGGRGHAAWVSAWRWCGGGGGRRRGGCDGRRAAGRRRSQPEADRRYAASSIVRRLPLRGGLAPAFPAVMRPNSHHGGVDISSATAVAWTTWLRRVRPVGCRPHSISHGHRLGHGPIVGSHATCRSEACRGARTVLPRPPRGAPRVWPVVGARPESGHRIPFQCQGRGPWRPRRQSMRY